MTKDHDDLDTELQLYWLNPRHCSGCEGVEGAPSDGENENSDEDDDIAEMKMTTRRVKRIDSDQRFSICIQSVKTDDRYDKRSPWSYHLYCK